MKIVKLLLNKVKRNGNQFAHFGCVNLDCNMLAFYIKNWLHLHLRILKAHQQISKKWFFEKYFSCDKAYQFSAL